MGQLEDMSLFVRVVESGSITKTAEQLNIAKPAVSRRLSELEKRKAGKRSSVGEGKGHLVFFSIVMKNGAIAANFSLYLPTNSS